MFRHALKVAAEYTRPIVISRRTVGGACSSSIGTYVVLNPDGWIVTAGHILSQWDKLVQNVKHTKDAVEARDAINSDKGLNRKERNKRLRAAPRVRRDDSDRCSAWWGLDSLKLRDFSYTTLSVPGFGEIIDIGIGRLEPFDSDSVNGYPVFKDPTRDFDTGTSLCKLGFPFHQITPVWDEAKEAFALPPTALPLPRFPIDGIFTREVNIVVENGPKLSYPVKYVETSTPGLKGQSGGPTIDSKGTVWAIQTKTSHWPLGFSGGQQFLNVGLGVHPETLFGVLDERGIGYQVSSY